MPRSTFEPAYTRFRKLLAEERRKKQITQAALAESLGKPQSFVSKYELGERRLDLVEFLAVAEAIGIEAGAFLKRLKTSRR